ncbi:ParA family protein [Streptomyces sp. Go40/10]|uniref:ParA family protein n=1 Tax=Streptomyces sp. Go40/10 TaxID=2825844 RepID=UPI001E35C161|nr:ParA family protein [Streptomyces sp. Go40/10]UFR07127.1 ParA family protein [Streptomyces sp. Go40/10]
MAWLSHREPRTPRRCRLWWRRVRAAGQVRQQTAAGFGRPVGLGRCRGRSTERSRKRVCPRPFRRSRVIAGGAGKTQGVANLAVEAAGRGHLVAVADFYPQRSASHILGCQDPPDGQPTIFDVLQGKHRLEEAVVPARYRIAEGDEDEAFRHIPDLDLILGTPETADAEANLGLDPAGVLWLQNVLDEQIPQDRWDMMFFDCGPTLGILLLSIAMVGPEVIACVADEFKYIIGLEDLEAPLDKGIRKFRRFGFKTEVQHILATNIPLKEDGGIRRSGGAVADDAIKAIRSNPEWEPKLLPIIRRKQRFKDTIVTQRPLRFLDPRNEALEDIAAVADALGIQRLNSTRKR